MIPAVERPAHMDAFSVKRRMLHGSFAHLVAREAVLQQLHESTELVVQLQVPSVHVLKRDSAHKASTLVSK